MAEPTWKTWKHGDIIRRTYADHNGITKGGMYIFDEFLNIDLDLIAVVGYEAAYDASKFELVESTRVAQFKKGDKVVCKSSHYGETKNSQAYWTNWTAEMDKFIGKIGRVSVVTESGVIRVDFNEPYRTFWHFHPEWLELVDAEYKPSNDSDNREKLKVEDVVVCISKEYISLEYGKEYIVQRIYPGGFIEVRENNGIWNPRSFELKSNKINEIIKEKKGIQKVMNSIVKFAKDITLSKEDKLLRKYGLVTECGEYTADAQQVIINKMCEDNKKYLIELAEKIEEEGKSKK